MPARFLAVAVHTRLTTVGQAGFTVGINQYIGRRPIAAFGNSDGDRQMLKWTQAGGGARLMMLKFRDDAKSEYAYGPGFRIWGLMKTEPEHHACTTHYYR
jgi:hypothetical protein